MAELPIRLELRAERSTIRPGEPFPVSVRITNTGESPIWFVGNVDGSEAGYRFPHYKPEIAGPEKADLGDGPFWCGTVVPLRIEDFVHLGPGQSFDPTDPTHGAGFQPLYLFTRYAPKTPGRYEMRLSVSTEGETEQDWGVIPVDYPGKQGIGEKLRQVPRGIAESAPLAITVE